MIVSETNQYWYVYNVLTRWQGQGLKLGFFLLFFFLILFMAEIFQPTFSYGSESTKNLLIVSTTDY